MGEVRDLSSARSARGHAEDHSLTLHAEPTAARVARHWVMRVVAAAGVGGSLNQLVEVLTAELVSDAVRLGDPDCRIDVRLRIADDCVRVAVTGPGPLVPTPSTTTSMALVEVLSSSWGMWPRPGGERTVWFDVATAG